MPTIGQLNPTSAVQPSDIVPLFVGMSQATRRATIAQLMEFVQENIVFPDQSFLIQYAGPVANNFDIEIRNEQKNVHLILTPSGPFPTGNITLPPSRQVEDGQVILVNTTNAVTSLTFTLNGAAAVIGVPEYMGQFGSFAIAYDLPSSNWYCISTGQVGQVTLDTAQTLSNKTFVNAALGTPVSGVLTNTTGFRVQNLANSTANILTFLQVPTAANLLAAVGGVTGTGNLVFASSPSLTTPNLGTPSAVNLANALGLPVQSLINITAALAAFFLSSTADNLRAAVGGVTGTGSLVFANGPTLLNPALGVPASGNLSNCTNLPIASGVSGLAANIANFLQLATSSNLAAAISDETGTGSLVFATGPTLQTPTINAPSYGAVVNKTASFTVQPTENMISCAGSASMTVTLPSAATFPGRVIYMKNSSAFTVVSSAANVGQLAGGAPTTAIMPATVGANVMLASDGANWLIMS